VLRDGVDPSTSGFSDRHSQSSHNTVTRNDANDLVASHRFVEQEMNSSFTVWTGIMQPMSVLSSTWTVPQPRPCMRFAVILCDLVKVALAMLADECVEPGKHSKPGF